MKLTETARNGDHLETLKALREVLARTIETTSSARETATLALQLRMVLTEIDELEQMQKKDEDALSMLLKRREEEGQPGAVRPDKRNQNNQQGK